MGLLNLKSITESLEKSYPIEEPIVEKKVLNESLNESNMEIKGIDRMGRVK